MIDIFRRYFKKNSRNFPVIVKAGERMAKKTQAQYSVEHRSWYLTIANCFKNTITEIKSKLQSRDKALEKKHHPTHNPFSLLQEAH